MKTFLISCAVYLLTHGVVSAAERTGGFAGAHLSYGQGKAHLEAIANGATTENKPSGWLGGIQGGYNWQSSNTVYGVEADLDSSSMRGSSACPNPTYTCKTEIRSLGTLRIRIGRVIGNDYSLYGTFGLAVGSVKNSIEPAPSGDSETKYRNGWVTGLGLAKPLNNHWTWHTEYLYVDLGSKRQSMNAIPIDDANSKVAFSLLRLGINYMF